MAVPRERVRPLRGHLDMFTLIGPGVTVTLMYSAVAVVAPGVLPSPPDTDRRGTSSQPRP